MTATTDAIQCWERVLLGAEKDRDMLISKVDFLAAYVKLLRAKDGEVVLPGDGE